MPYPYSYFKPTGKEQGAMAIGSLLAGLLSAAQPRQQGEASPVLKGIAGATAGYGGGHKAYQEMMQDSWGRDVNDRKFGQDVNQFDQQMGLNKEKFTEEQRQYEEIKKPYMESRIKHNDALSEYYKTDKRTPVDYNKIRDERTLRRLDIRKKQKELAGAGAGVGGEKTMQQLLEEALKEGNEGGATNQPPQITLDQFLNEARKVNPGISDDELKRYYNKKYGQ